MNQQLRFSLEIFISSYNNSNKIDWHLPDSVLEYFLNQDDDLQDFTETYIEEIGVVTRENFDNLVSNQLNKESILNKKKALVSYCKKLKSIDEYLVSLNDPLLTESKVLYDNYLHETFHVRDREVFVYRFELFELHQVFKKAVSLCKDIARFKVNQEVGEELEFSKHYNPKKKIIKDSPSDACWEVMENNPNLSAKELVGIVLENYWFRKYSEDTDRKKVEIKIKKAVRSSYQYITDKLDQSK